MENCSGFTLGTGMNNDQGYTGLQQRTNTLRSSGSPPYNGGYDYVALHHHAARYGWTVQQLYQRCQHFGMIVPQPMDGNSIVTMDNPWPGLPMRSSMAQNQQKVSSNLGKVPAVIMANGQPALAIRSRRKVKAGPGNSTGLVQVPITPFCVSLLATAGNFGQNKSGEQVSLSLTDVSTSGGLSTENRNAMHTERATVNNLASVVKKSAVPARRSSQGKRKAVGEADTVTKRQRSSGNLPFGKPEVWADRRQQLCETVPYYDSYQSSWYAPKLDARSMLLAKDDSPRSYTDDQIIITRATGAMSTDPDNKTSMIQTKSHSKNDNTVKAIQLACKSKKAIVILASGKCTSLPSEMPYNFQVLDQYWITDYWWEKNNGFAVFKCRFERCEPERQPWYAAKDKVFPTPDYEVTCSAESCSHCHGQYLQVYQVWMCLNHECQSFWKLPNGSDPDENVLVFNDAFLKKRTVWTGKKEFDIKPAQFDPSTHDSAQYVYSRDGWYGFWCEKCGQCSSRENWSSWNCPCGNSRTVDPPILTPKQTNVGFDDDKKMVTSISKTPKSTIQPKVTIAGKYTIETYVINEGNRVHHFRSCPELNAQPNGPDQLFEELQIAKDLKLQRRLLGHSTSRTPTGTLTRHFSQNFGLPYKFVVAQDSTPFKDAPSLICHAMQRQIWAGETVGMDASKPFNEMLVVGYRSEGGMGYHDDGEKELGSTVSTLSLGSEAVMKFRYKGKYHDPPLNFKTDLFKPEKEVVAGVPLEIPRQLLQQWMSEHKDATKEQMKAQFKKYPAVREIMNGTEKLAFHKDVVQILLKHGDICIMEGPDIQKFMEHEVEPLGCLRFALTSRHILRHMVTPEELHMGDFDVSAYPKYEGLIDSTASTSSSRNA